MKTEFTIRTEINGGEYDSKNTVTCTRLVQIDDHRVQADGVEIYFDDPIETIEPEAEKCT